ncbi:carbohydrate ABC transporter permease [Lacticaseibacillus absianus]|uniref:carbohydrate ABC transporter permease n=1 Tax=Lacticaseibacillus absianus TaxID=2729623 RepID=UPI001C542D83|nr:sugar ABC transporter permease [Lacticaseibacillus absianus]
MAHTKQRRENMTALMFIGVGLFLFTVFIFYPQVKNVYMAFTNYNIMPGSENRFVGFENFKSMFATGGTFGNSDSFMLALRNSVLAVLVTVPGQLILGLVIAIMIDRVSHGRLFYKVMLYIPVISSWVVVSILFKYLFQDTKGSLINYYLLKLNLISHPVAWLQNTWTASAVIWALCIWKGVGWVIIIYNAAIQTLPKELYEVSYLEGANPIQRFFYITLPLLKKTTIYVVVQLTIGAFGIMIQVMLITAGGPMGTTETLNSYMYSKAFTEFQFGYSSAVSLVMGAVVIGTTLLQRKLMREEK